MEFGESLRTMLEVYRGARDDIEADIRLGAAVEPGADALIMTLRERGYIRAKARRKA